MKTWIKLILLLTTSTGILMVSSALATFLVWIFLMTLITLFGIKHRLRIRYFKPLILTVFMVMVFQLVFNIGIPLYERLLLSFTAASRILTLSTLVFIFSAVTSPLEILSVLGFLPPSIRLAITITFSLIPIIFIEADSIRTVQTSRGFKSSWNPISAFIPLIIPLLHRTLRRAEHLALTMEARGYET